MIHSYPKIYNLGHVALANLFDDNSVLVQEKYDGSQLSWMWDVEGELFVKSKGKMQAGGGAVTDKMFNGAVEYLTGIDQPAASVNCVFRGEWFTSAKHNTLAYDARPLNGLVLYDAEWAPSDFATVNEVAEMAEEQGISSARTLEVWSGLHPILDHLKAWLATESSLGGPLVEGVVFKNYARMDPFQPDKVLMGKYVSDDFREKHGKAWKAKNPGRGDVIEGIVAQLNTEARWEKAVQHLRDNGDLEGSPRDIGALMVEVKRDILEEEKIWILAKLQQNFLPKITRGLGRGLPDWYKAKLVEEAIDNA